MNFTELNNLIPYALGGKAKVLTMQPYNGITLALPGRHASDTTPKGGDFVVMVDDDAMDWTKHQFTHVDLFRDFETKAKASSRPGLADGYITAYSKVIAGEDPSSFVKSPNFKRVLPGIHPLTLQYAVQCLAVAEHRRYRRFEGKYGGRYLPFRFTAGIVEGLWTAAEAAELQRRGRPGVEILERRAGMPALTKELMNG